MKLSVFIFIFHHLQLEQGATGQKIQGFVVCKSKIFRSRNIVGSEFSFFSIIISFDLCHLFVVILMRGHPYITSRRFSHNLRDFQGGWSENYFNITHSLSLLAFTEIPSEETGGALAWIQCAATSCGKSSKKQIFWDKIVSKSDFRMADRADDQDR